MPNANAPESQAEVWPPAPKPPNEPAAPPPRVMSPAKAIIGFVLVVVGFYTVDNFLLELLDHYLQPLFPRSDVYFPMCGVNQWVEPLVTGLLVAYLWRSSLMTFKQRAGRALAGIGITVAIGAAILGPVFTPWIRRGEGWNILLHIGGNFALLLIGLSAASLALHAIDRKRAARRAAGTTG